MAESLEKTQETVRWLKNLHVWGIALGLPLIAWAIGEYHQRGRR